MENIGSILSGIGIILGIAIGIPVGLISVIAAVNKIRRKFAEYTINTWKWD